MLDTLDLTDLTGYVTLKQASRIMGVKHNTLYKRVLRKKVPLIHVERVFLVRLSDIEKCFIEE